MFANDDYRQLSATLENRSEMTRALRIQMLCQYDWSGEVLGKRADESGQSSHAAGGRADDHQIVALVEGFIGHDYVFRGLNLSHPRLPARLYHLSRCPAIADGSPSCFSPLPALVFRKFGRRERGSLCVHARLFAARGSSVPRARERQTT